MHRLERALDRSSGKKKVVARASYITCENRRSDIVHLSHLLKLNRAIEPAQMHRLDRTFDHRSVNKAYICGNRMSDASIG